MEDIKRTVEEIINFIDSPPSDDEFEDNGIGLKSSNNEKEADTRQAEIENIDDDSVDSNSSDEEEFETTQTEEEYFGIFSSSDEKSETSQAGDDFHDSSDDEEYEAIQAEMQNYKDGLDKNNIDKKELELKKLREENLKLIAENKAFKNKILEITENIPTETIQNDNNQVIYENREIDKINEFFQIVGLGFCCYYICYTIVFWLF